MSAKKQKPAQQQTTTWRRKCAVGAGVLLMLVGLLGTAAAAESLVWQLQTMWKYTQGECKVVKAEVVSVGFGYELNIEHQVVLNGKAYKTTRNTEQHTPSYNQLPDAQAALALYPVGSLQPCWYDAQSPDRHSVLVKHDMDTLFQSLVFIVSLLLGKAGIMLLRY